MPVSLPEDRPPGQSLAVTAEVLYLLNMLPLPGIAFVALLWLYWRHYENASALARGHLSQTVIATFWAAGLLLGLNLLILGLGGYRSPSVWVVVFLYFVTCHSAFILLGVIGLVKALAGQPYRYPLVGRNPFVGAR